MPPPVVVAEFPDRVLFWTRSVPFMNGTETPPPGPVAALPLRVLFRTTIAFGVNPAGGVALGVPRRRSPPPPFPPADVLLETVLFSINRPPLYRYRAPAEDVAELPVSVLLRREMNVPPLRKMAPPVLPELPLKVM